MDKQTIADELARLAGWTREVKPMRCSKRIHPSGSTAASFWVRAGQADEFNHPYPVGSLDALEAFRRERLPEWNWYFIHADAGLDNDWNACVYRNGGPPFIQQHGPDEWTARASALIAAAKENKP